jgi:hypothetical protein
MGRKGSRLTEQRLVPFQATQHAVYPYDRPRALHQVPSAVNDSNLILPAGDVRIDPKDYNIYANSQVPHAQRGE